MSVKFQVSNFYKVTLAKVNNFGVLIIGSICRISGQGLKNTKKILIYYQPNVRPKM